MARLAAHVWVGAYLARLRAAAIPAYVIAKGDQVSGTVLVKVTTMDGQAVALTRSFDLMTGERTWVVLTEGPEHEVDESIARQRSFDRDLWVIEVEDPKGRHLLDEEGLQ